MEKSTHKLSAGFKQFDIWLEINLVEYLLVFFEIPIGIKVNVLFIREKGASGGVAD